MDAPVTGHHTVSRSLSPFHPEIGAAVLDQRVHLLEAALVEELLDPLAGGQLPLLVLAVDLVLSTTEAVGGQPFLQSVNNLTAHPRPPGTLAPGILPRTDRVGLRNHESRSCTNGSGPAKKGRRGQRRKGARDKERVTPAPPLHPCTPAPLPLRIPGSSALG